MDPLAGKYPHSSPYVYCANNPIQFVDLYGNSFIDNTPGWMKSAYNSFRQGVSEVLNVLKTGAAISDPVTGGGEAVSLVADAVDALIPQTLTEAVIDIQMTGLGVTAAASASIPSTSVEGLTNTTASEGQSVSAKTEEGLTTPSKFFGNKTKQEAETALGKKFGPARSERVGAKTYYDAKNKRSYNVHHQEGHQGDKPHVDIRKRGLEKERKILLKDQNRNE